MGLLSFLHLGGKPPVDTTAEKLGEVAGQPDSTTATTAQPIQEQVQPAGLPTDVNNSVIAEMPVTSAPDASTNPVTETPPITAPETPSIPVEQAPTKAPDMPEMASPTPPTEETPQK